MPFSRAEQLASRAPVVQGDTPLGLVAENLRASSGGVVAVLDRVTPGAAREGERNGRVVGIITQDDLARASERAFAPEREVAALNGHASAALSLDGARTDNGEAAPPALPATSPLELLQELRARDVMREGVAFVPAQSSLASTLLSFDRAGVGALPVLDASNRYLGMISRADVLSALTGQVRPPVVGGVATPLGVWLTDGVLSGGASNVGLLLTGLTMAFYLAGSQIALYFIARALNPEWGALALSGRLGVDADGSNVLNTAFTLLQIVLFLLLFRLTPLSGVHAAEHQTVHALERGLPLTVENVRQMPRVHPRCGTNVTVIGGLICAGIIHLPEISVPYILGVLLATFFAWRTFGDAIQFFFTTRPASTRQIESGIAAANELMRSYQSQSQVRTRSPLGLLNRGMVMVAIGLIVGSTLVNLAWNALAMALR